MKGSGDETRWEGILFDAITGADKDIVEFKEFGITTKHDRLVPCLIKVYLYIYFYLLR